MISAQHTDHGTLTIRHNSGFFSCCTIAFIEVIKYFNANKHLPEIFDRSEQFVFYKTDPAQDIVPLLFKEKDIRIPHYGEIVVTKEPGEISFGEYSKFHFDEVAPFVNRYFSPSDKVSEIIQMYKDKYIIDYENTCAVFYRGNDKQMECDVTSYEAFILAAKELPEHIRFMVVPDETEFMEAFTAAFPDRCFTPEETPHMRKKNSAIFYELPGEKKTDHALNFLAAVIAMSKCKYVIQHSGNGAMWLSLYRGNMENVHQFMTKHRY